MSELLKMNISEWKVGSIYLHEFKKTKLYIIFKVDSIIYNIPTFRIIKTNALSWQNEERELYRPAAKGLWKENTKVISKDELSGLLL